MTLAPGCLIDDEQDAALAATPRPRALLFSGPSTATPMSRMRTGAPLLVGDDGGVPWRRRRQLIVVVDGEVARGAVDRTLCGIDRDGRDGARDVLEGQPESGELRRIDLHADRGLLPGRRSRDLRHAGQLGELLRQDVFGVVVDLVSAAARRNVPHRRRSGGSAGLTLR